VEIFSRSSRRLRFVWCMLTLCRVFIPHVKKTNANKKSDASCQVAAAIFIYAKMMQAVDTRLLLPSCFGNVFSHAFFVHSNVLHVVQVSRKGEGPAKSHKI